MQQPEVRAQTVPEVPEVPEAHTVVAVEPEVKRGTVAVVVAVREQHQTETMRWVLPVERLLPAVVVVAMVPQPTEDRGFLVFNLEEEVVVDAEMAAPGASEATVR